METKLTQMKGLSIEQKTGFVLLLIFGLLAVGLGLLQMRNVIYNPFAVRFDKDIAAQSLLDDNTKLQQIDTDRDTINDYQEITFYQTSAYLPDTDSDGINDNIEIQNGTDPLCPEGTICMVTDVKKSDTTEQQPETDTKPLEYLKTITDAANQAVALENTTQTVTADGQADLSTLVNDPTMLRKLLLSSGKITEEQLSKIDDKTILDMAKSIDTSQLKNTQ